MHRLEPVNDNNINYNLDFLDLIRIRARDSNKEDEDFVECIAQLLNEGYDNSVKGYVFQIYVQNQKFYLARRLIGDTLMIKVFDSARNRCKSRVYTLSKFHYQINENGELFLDNHGYQKLIKFINENMLFIPSYYSKEDIIEYL